MILMTSPALVDFVCSLGDFGADTGALFFHVQCLFLLCFYLDSFPYILEKLLKFILQLPTDYSAVLFLRFPASRKCCNYIFHLLHTLHELLNFLFTFSALVVSLFIIPRSSLRFSVIISNWHILLNSNEISILELIFLRVFNVMCHFSCLQTHTLNKTCRQPEKIFAHIHTM